MKDKLEPNMYVRTKKGKIYKFDTNNSMAKNGAKKYMVNCSYNIIDLIERFDLVNGHLVICKMYENEKDIPTIVKCVGDYYFKEEDIKSIVTHEQMEQMAYKVGE